MNEPEPTAEYAIESSWSNRLMAIGFRDNDRADLCYRGDDNWLIEAYLTRDEKHVQFKVYGPGGLEAFTEVPLHCALRCARLLIDLLDDNPYYETRVRVRCAGSYATNGR